jgi:hypothetical protein
MTLQRRAALSAEAAGEYEINEMQPEQEMGASSRIIIIIKSGVGSNLGDLARALWRSLDTCGAGPLRDRGAPQ